MSRDARGMSRKDLKPRAQNAPIPDKAARRTIESHGYAFQYSVLHAIEELRWRGKEWVLEATEFPVRVGGKSTHIDFVLRNSLSSLFLIGECKRVTGKLSSWCFFKTPYTLRNPQEHTGFVEAVFFSGDRGTRVQSAKGIPFHTESPIVNLGFAASTSELSGEDENPSDSRKAIEGAMAQVFRGVNGFVEHLSRIEANSHESRAVRILPAIFTTARLYISDLDLRDANLRTGGLEKSDLALRPVDWLIYNYHVSPDLKHSYSWTSQATIGDRNRTDTTTHASLHEALSLADTVRTEYLRSVVIVSPAGIKQFVKAEFDPSWWR